MIELPIATTLERTYEKVRLWAENRGIRVNEGSLAADKAGEFDGRSVTMNGTFASEERLYYLAHSLGSIVRWSLARRSKPIPVFTPVPIEHQEIVQKQAT